MRKDKCIEKEKNKRVEHPRVERSNYDFVKKCFGKKKSCCI